MLQPNIISVPITKNHNKWLLIIHFHLYVREDYKGISKNQEKIILEWLRRFLNNILPCKPQDKKKLFWETSDCMFRLMKSLDIKDKNKWKAWNITRPFPLKTR